MFRTVLDSMPDNELAKSGLASALNAPAIKQAGSRYKVKRMDVFNSRRADYSPVLAGDALDHLYFSSTRNEAEGDDEVCCDFHACSSCATGSSMMCR